MRASLIVGQPDDIKGLTFVRQQTQTIVEALDLGFFAFSSKDLVVQVSGKENSTTSELEIVFEGTRININSLMVLQGMLEWGRYQYNIILKDLRVCVGERQAENGLIHKSLLAKEAFDLAPVRPAHLSAGEQLIIYIHFRRAAEQQQLELLRRGFTIWSGLVCGGFPPAGSPPGTSFLGATGGYLVGPTAFQWFTEGIVADPSALDLLVNFVSGHRRELDVCGMEYEA